MVGSAHRPLTSPRQPPSVVAAAMSPCWAARSRHGSRRAAGESTSSPHHRRHQHRLPPPCPLRRSVGLVFQRTDLQATTGYSSVGRASDCRTSQESDGPWFDSGWPDFLGRFPSGHASLSVGRAPFFATRVRVPVTHHRLFIDDTGSRQCCL